MSRFVTLNNQRKLLDLITLYKGSRRTGTKKFEGFRLLDISGNFAGVRIKVDQPQTDVILL